MKDTNEPSTTAAAVGFSDPERMRRAFLRLYGGVSTVIATKNTLLI
jgi:AraC-like DNA-binding protein